MRTTHRNRSPAGWSCPTPMMRTCGSATRRSTKASTCTPVANLNANSPRTCAPAAGSALRRGRVERRGGISDPVSIHDRPEEITARLVPGHHEGDLIKGSQASNTAVGTIVERATGYLTLLHLPAGYQADLVAAAVITELSALPDWFAKTLTWDRGTEMSQHKIVTAAGFQVYFADPHAPWQRGSNENINGLIRQYLPKGTDLSIHTKTDLQAIADRLNDRPRKRLGYKTPREAFTTLLTKDIERVATTT